ncbi:MAG: insulinase family protein [Hyphomicrobiaceae bacterium]|nr:insulinase family protein [Hyphomicrobiaceae bacterium]
MIRNGVRHLSTLVIALMTLTLVPQSFAAESASRVSQFELSNGMQVVVIPDNRAPVVTHMVFYRAGAADEPPGVSGIAHFLEHLMFKSTEKIPNGEFSKVVERLGGELNAFTTQDVTAYFERVAKGQLAKMMEMEADRMVNLRLTDEEVVTERNVILEERRSRVENNPGALFGEQMEAMLYQNHPYGIPVIGWEHEMSKLSRADALAFYKRFYSPNNATLVVAGDVTADEVKALAEATYGRVPAVDPALLQRARPQEPPARAARRLTLEDPRAGQPSLHRYYLAPSYNTAPEGDAEALDVLVKVLAEGSTSRLYMKLVVADKVAASASGNYQNSGLDSGSITLYAVASSQDDLVKAEAAIDATIADIKANGLTDAEIQRAKAGLIADYVYESDSQSTLARRYGWGLSTGLSIARMEAWPDAIRKVTAEDVKRVANTYFDIRSSVTGLLLPKEQEAAGSSTPAGIPAAGQSPAPGSRS